MTELNTSSIQTLLRTRKNDFHGLPLVVNYAHYPPYCIVKKQANGTDKVSGLFIDTLQIATQYLNLTLVLQKPKAENRNIWFKR